MEKKKEERLIKELKELAKLPANKRCADCTARLPTYANLTHRTFICTGCSGIHREFSHRAKSISLSSFSADEVKLFREGGNEAVNKVYLAKWDPRDFPEPEPGNEQKSRDWIRAKYIEKRWHVDSNYAPARRGSRDNPEAPRRSGDAGPPVRRGSGGGSSRNLGTSGQRDNIPQSQPISAVLPDVKQVEVKKPEPKKPGADLLDLIFAPGSPEPAPPAPVQQQQQQHGGGFANDPFGGAPGGWGGFPPGPQQGYPPQGGMPPQPPQQGLFPPQPPQQGFAGFPQGPGAPPGPGFGTDPFAQPVFPPHGAPAPQAAFNPGFGPPNAFPQQPPPQAHMAGFPPGPSFGGPMPPQGAFPGAPNGPAWPQGPGQQPGPCGPPGQFAGFGPQPGAPQPPPTPQRPPATVSIDDAFNELSVSGPPIPAPEVFKAGELVLYTDSQGRTFPGEVVKVHVDDHPPYYTIKIAGGGPERQTDFHHLKRRAMPPPPQQHGPPQPQPHPQGPPPPQPQGPPPPADPFSNLGQAAWNGVTMPGNGQPPRGPPIDPFGGPPPTQFGGPPHTDNPFGQPDVKGMPFGGQQAPPGPSPFGAPVHPFGAPANPYAPPTQGGPPPVNPFFTPQAPASQPPATGNPFDMF